jgi:hypothetical protein
MQGVTEPWVESVKESWLFSIQFMQWVHESFLERIFASPNKCFMLQCMKA